MNCVSLYRVVKGSPATYEDYEKVDALEADDLERQ